jgi:hypothetical protein
VLATTSAVDGLVEAMAADIADPTPMADRPDVVLVEEVASLLRLRSQLDAAIAVRLSAVDLRDATVAESGRATRAWLVEDHQLDQGPAARKLRLARVQGIWAATDDAWRRGEISEDHAAVIYSALRHVHNSYWELVEQTLLDYAHTHTPRECAEAVDMILVACGIEKSADAAAARRYAERGVTVARTFGGSGSLAGTLTALLCEKLEQALEIAGKPAGPEDERTRAQRYHDALETIVDHYIDTSDQVPAQLNGERTAKVIVTVPLEVLEQRLASEWALLPSGARIAPETARRIACEAEVIPAVLGGRNVLDGHDVIDIGQGKRTFEAHVRRAAILRDGDRCVFPQCRNPRAEAHHWRVHWANGGKSDLDNCAWLCRFHHWLVHEGGWRMWREADGGYTFTAPTRRQYTSSKVPRAPWEVVPDTGGP